MLTSVDVRPSVEMHVRPPFTGDVGAEGDRLIRSLAVRERGTEEEANREEIQTGTFTVRISSNIVFSLLVK